MDNSVIDITPETPLLVDNSINREQDEKDSVAPSNGVKHLMSLLLLSFGFFFVFVSYNGTQNLLSSLHQSLGYWSGATIYISFCFGSLVIAPGLVNLIGPKFSLLLGSITYAAFMAANLKPIWGVLIPSAAALGIGASILWTAQGGYLTVSAANYSDSRKLPTKSAMGLFNGIFFGIFFTTQVVGNLISALVLKHQNTAKYLFYIYLAIASFGVLLFIFLRKEVSSRESLQKTENETKSVFKRFLDAILLLRDFRMLLLIAILFYNGLEMGFIFGDFTAHFIKPILGKGEIGYVMAVFGGVDAFSCFTIGKLTDIFGKRIVLVLGFIIHLAFFGFFIYIFQFMKDHEKFLEEQSWILYLAAGIYGIGDAVWNTVPATLCSIFFTDNTEAAFSNLKLWQSLGFFAAFVWGPYLSIVVKMAITAGVLILGSVCLACLDMFVANINKNEQFFANLCFDKH